VPSKEKLSREDLLSRIDILMEVNRDLANEVNRLSRIVSALTGPQEAQTRVHSLIWKQGRTRNLEKILTAVAEIKT
jgi:hypothetical protein